MHNILTLKSCRLDLITPMSWSLLITTTIFLSQPFFFSFCQNISLPSKICLSTSAVALSRKMVETKKLNHHTLQLKSLFDNFPSLLEKKKDDLLGVLEDVLYPPFCSLTYFLLSLGSLTLSSLPLCHEGCLAALSQMVELALPGPGWSLSRWLWSCFFTFYSIRLQILFELLKGIVKGI